MEQLKQHFVVVFIAFFLRNIHATRTGNASFLVVCKALFLSSEVHRHSLASIGIKSFYVIKGEVLYTLDHTILFCSLYI